MNVFFFDKALDENPPADISTAVAPCECLTQTDVSIVFVAP